MTGKERLFAQEEETLQKAMSALTNATENQSTEVEINEFESLLEGYKRMYKQFRTLVNISDKQQKRLNTLHERLELRNRIIKKTFSRYLSDDVVKVILESPEGATLGGEKLEVTILLCDLRGFTAVTESMPAEKIVKTLNIYQETMTDIIYKYQGTIDEFIGDAILAIFGAPLKQEDHAGQAVACAIEMQSAIEKVNEKNRHQGLPNIQMGIGINTGELVVGNIGSQKRMKYGVVGSHVNLTSRIESYTSGGQVFISGNTMEKCSSIIEIKDTFEVMPKGVDKPITIHDITGIGGTYDVYLPKREEPLMHPLKTPLEIKYFFITEKHVEAKSYPGTLVNYGGYKLDIYGIDEVRKFSDLKILFPDKNQPGTFFTIYGKVVKILNDASIMGFRMDVTSIPPEAEQYLSNCL